MLAATVHIGSENSETTMMPYIFKTRNDGVNIVNLKKTWEKMMLAARAIASIENPQDIFVVSCRPYGQRAVLKFARYTGATAIAGRYTPGEWIFLDHTKLLQVSVLYLLRHASWTQQGSEKCQKAFLMFNKEKIKYPVGSTISNYWIRCAEMRVTVNN